VSQVRIFLSSTFEDLLDYRQAVDEAIRGLNLHSDDMLVWPADSRSPAENSIDRVRRSDILVLLVAHRYGTIPDGADKSIVELEYLAARAAGIPVYAFFVDEDHDWPPKHMDESRSQVRDFKARVAKDVTRKFFRSQQELALLVTQALAHHVARSAAPASRRFTGTVRAVSTVSRLRSDPDVLVPIGTAEDDLPLLLEVSRSRDLSGPFQQLRDAIGSADHPAPDDLLTTFRESLTDHATRAWAGQDLHRVRLRRGETRTLYVTPFTLSGPFTSILAGFLGNKEADAIRGEPITAQLPFQSTSWVDDDYRELTAPPLRLPFLDSTGPGELQSTGGRNRFLAIDPEDGATYSVGISNGQWVEWRPFLCESVLPALPGTTLNVDTWNGFAVEDATQNLLRLYWPPTPDGRLNRPSVLRTARSTLLNVLVGVAEELVKLHDRGVVHGDVKPGNVLLLKSGVTLIDSFDVAVGKRSPGWTPNWSAPEQVRGEPVTPAADVYPLAIMAARILGGEIVGEVRKFRTPRDLPTPREVDLFYNPSLYLSPDAPVAGAWREFIERSLSFDPARRPANAEEFADEIETLTPALAGYLEMRPTGDLVAARLIDGTETVARMVSARDTR
jgi:hypothetical protein